MFIEEIIESEDLKHFWKDEILVAILLSKYSYVFFDIFKERLLENSLELLKRISFLLRIACKEVDNSIIKKLGIKDTNSIPIERLLTKPKGEGWKSLIKFVYDNLDSIGINNIKFILPVIYEWNNKFIKGNTTKEASIIALKYYQLGIEDYKYFPYEDEAKDNLFATILKGSSEIKSELSNIFEEIIRNKWREHRAPYYDFVKAILTKWEYNIELIKYLPNYILKLANLFWVIEEKNRYPFGGFSMDIEDFFGITGHYDYYPASSFQTPIYWLLQVDFRETVDFILSFTNRAIEKFSTSDLGKNEVEIINVYLGKGKYSEQYICDRLWNIYRGTQVAPEVLESIHMALEKFMLEIGKDIDSEVLESWLLYFLTNAKSSSITALVISTILAYPDKTFNVAKVIFQTKELFFYDTTRLVLDQNANLNFSIGYGLNFNHKIHQDERIKSCDDAHRRKSLESLVLWYQFFRRDNISEQVAKDRQEIIYKIIDKYYEELNIKSHENDKTWRLYLARMDRRKMNPIIEEKEEGLVINFNPKIDDDLAEFSESSTTEYNERNKYLELNLWANFKMKNDEKHKKYERYNKNPSLVIKEVKEIVKELETATSRDYYLFNHSIPGQACSVLIRDYYNKLTVEEKEFCKEVILSVSLMSINDNYSYQISDGIESAIYVLPLLLKEFLGEKDKIKGIILLTLFDETNIGSYCRFSEYSIKAIVNNLWNNSFEEAQSLLLGYLLLKPRYEEIRNRIRNGMGNNYFNEISKSKIITAFIQENEQSIENVLANKIEFEDIEDIKSIELYILRTAFELLPFKLENKEHKELAKKIICVFSREFLLTKREDRVDYMIKHGFIDKLTYIALSSSEKDAEYYLESFINEFNNMEVIADIFKQFIITQDNIKNYNTFWYIWNLFKENVIKRCQDKKLYWDKDKMIKSYLFAQSPWREKAEEWHTLKESNKLFFKDITEKLGNYPSVLYSITKLLNNIGSIYFNDGVLWISNMLVKNKDLQVKDIDANTIYYLEKYIRKFIYINREKIKTVRKLKFEVIVVLDFLIEKGSVVGYILRENIL